MPISTRKYWYITDYFLLMLFSGYINKIVNCLSKKQYLKLMLIFITVFSILPTLLYFHVIDDGGKCVITLLIMYLIGQYLRKYEIDFNISNKRLLLYAAVVLIVECAGNFVAAIIIGGKGVWAPFGRDCTLFTLTLSILVFIIFLKIHFYSHIVNIVAKSVIAIYLFEETIRTALDMYINWAYFENKIYTAVIITIYVIAVMVICIIVDKLRGMIVRPFDKIWEKFVDRINEKNISDCLKKVIIKRSM